MRGIYSPGASVQSNNKCSEARVLHYERAFYALLPFLHNSRLCWRMCRPFPGSWALLGLWSSSVSFEWATLYFLFFSPAQRNCFCLLMGIFTFPRERHYSLGVMSASAPHPWWEHKPILKGGREEAAVGVCTIATGASICRCRGLKPASEPAAGRECLLSQACMHYAQPIP